MLPIVIPSFINDFLSAAAAKHAQNQESSQTVYPSYHTQTINFGNPQIPKKLQISARIIANVEQSLKDGMTALFLKFPVNSLLKNQPQESAFEEFKKLVRQVVTVSSALDMSCRELFKRYKLEAQREIDHFVIAVKLAPEESNYWRELQDQLMLQFKDISKEELLLIRFGSSVGIKEIQEIHDKTVLEIVYQILKDSSFELHSLINKIGSVGEAFFKVSEDEKEKEQEDKTKQQQLDNTLPTDSIFQSEAKQRDLLSMLFLLRQSQLEITLDSFEKDELENLGIFAFPISPIVLPFQPAILTKIRNLMKAYLSGEFTIVLANSKSEINLAIETGGSLETLIDILFAGNS